MPQSEQTITAIVDFWAAELNVWHERIRQEIELLVPGAARRLQRARVFVEVERMAGIVAAELARSS